MAASFETLEQSAQWYEQLFKEQPPADGGAVPAYQAPLRTAALQRFAELGFPHRKVEAWKYTNVSPMVRIPFQPVPAAGRIPSASDIEPFLYTDVTAGCLVFVDGHYVPDLSRTPDMPAGVIACPLSAAAESHSDVLEAHLGRYLVYNDMAFAALNTAFMQDGLCLVVPDGVGLDRPVQALFLSTGRDEPSASYPRNLVVAGSSSRVQIIESYHGLDASTYQVNTVSEIVTGANAAVEHYILQQESPAAYHIGTLHIRQDRDSVYQNHNLAFGGRLARTDITALLTGEGGHCALNGIYIGRGQQHMDAHTRIEHVVPHCTSHELYKGILDDEARGVFNGKIYVHPHAVKTDAIQSNNNVLLSETARADTKPELEIYADDVKCTHGGTVGKLDDAASFYLRSRGIPEKEARDMLLRAFAAGVLGAMGSDAVRDRISRVITERLQ